MRSAWFLAMVLALLAAATAPVHAATTVEKRIATSADDAEERTSNGKMTLNSPTLELTFNTAAQIVGMRWTGLAIPPGATITAAWVQFTTAAAASGATNLTFSGQAADNAATFGKNSRNVSSRPLTKASVAWAPAAWTTVGQAGTGQRTPDLSAVIQEIVSRAGWASGNALAIIIAGTGQRTAYANDGNGAAAGLLHVEYTTTAPVDQPPVAKLSVTQAASPPLTVSASGAGSTDTDATPIASYSFSFGDGTPAVVTASSTATHTYAAAGTYTVTLIVTDTAKNGSAPVTSKITVSSGSTGSSIAVYVGYYDTHHAVNPKSKPSPWQGSPNVVFIGKADDSSNNWDSSCIRVDNLSSGSLSGVVVTADLGSNHFALWGTNTIPAGYKLILAQTAFQNFDGSDTNPAGCYGCDPKLCLSERSTDIPVVHVTVSSATKDYLDNGQVLNTGGYDGAGCPYVGGTLPQTRYDESHPWTQIYTSSGAAVAAATSATTGTDSPPVTLPRVLALAPPSPNPARGVLALRFTLPTDDPVWLGLYDVSGRLVRTYVNDRLRAGDYDFRRDVTDVSPGVYFVRLTTPGASLHQRLVVAP